MKRKVRRVLAVLAALVVTSSAIQFPAKGAGPNFPGVTVAENSMGSITALDKNNKELLIHTTASGNQITLSLTFPKDGGVRLCDKDSEGTNGMFAPEEVTNIIYTDNGNSLTAVGEAGTGIVLNYSEPVWTLSVRKSSDDTEVYLLKADDLRTSYNTEGVRTSVGLKGSIASAEKFIGLGERYSGVVLNGKTYELWNKDCWSEGTQSYVNVPLLHSSNGYSLFFNSFYAAEADIGEADSSSFSLDFAGPDIDIYIWTDTPLENLKDYMALTGTSAAIPEWAVHYWAGGADDGFWVSSTQTEAEILEELLKNYKSLGTMPYAVYGEREFSTSTDVYTIADQYQVKVLGWNHPDIPWAWVGQKYTADYLEKYCYYTLNSAKPVIYKLSDPTQFFTYLDSGNTCLKIDYTHKNASNLINRNMKKYWTGEYALSGVMVDYGEYIEEDMLFSNGLTGAEMHNLQAYYYNKAVQGAWEGDESPKKGDYVLFARAGCAGSQSFAAQFGGDQQSTFEGLQKAIQGGISSSASGFSIWGSDIGGLSGSISDELYLRWLGFGAFSPLMRVHGTADHNPFAFSKSAQTAFTKYYWLRENLADVIYSAALQSNLDGTPVMQSMAMAFPEDKNLFGIDDQYLFCNEILVCPVYTAGATSRTVTLPEGIWYDLWDGEKIVSNGTAMTVSAPVDETPAFIRSGSVMPVDISSDTLALTDSMENDNSTRALLVTPAEGGENRTSTWLYDDKTLEYTIATDTVATTIDAKQGNNAKIIVAKDIIPEQVLVDGEELSELGSKPSGTQTGYYIEEASNQTYIALPSHNWRSVELVTNEEPPIVDYAFTITKQQNTDYLDKAFDVYKFNAPTSADGAKAAVGPVAPSATDPDAETVSYYTTQLYGSNSRGYLKPANVFSNGFTALTYKRNTFTDFDAEYEMLGTYSIFGIAFGGEAGVFPISRDENASNDTGVVVYMEHDGYLSIGGAIDAASVTTTGGLTFTAGGQSNLAGTTNIRTSSMTGGVSIGVDANPTDATKTNKVCIHVRDGVLTVWEKSNPDKKVSVKQTSNYQGGAVSLIANQIHHGAFKSFSITSLDSELIYQYDFEHLADVSDLDETFTAYRMTTAGTDKVSGMVSEYWTRSTTLDGGCANKPYFKALHRASANQYTFLSYTKAQVYDFEAAAEIANNYTVYGMTIASEGSLLDNVNGVSVRLSAEGSIYIKGAIDVASAASTGVNLTCSDGSISTSAISGFITVNNYASQETIYTLHVMMENGVLTVTVDEYPDVKVSVKMTSAYEGGIFSLYTNGCNQGGFKTLDLNIPARDTVIFEKNRSGQEVTYTVQTTESYGGISARIEYDSSVYTYADAVAADGVTADVRTSDGSIQLYMYGTGELHMGEWITLKFTMAESQKSSLSVKVRTAADHGGSRRARSTQVFLGDVNDDNERNVLDLIRLKKYENSCKEEFKVYRHAADGSETVSGKASEYWSIDKKLSVGSFNYEYDAAYLRPMHRGSWGYFTYLSCEEAVVKELAASVKIANNYTQYGIAVAPAGEKQTAANGIAVYVGGSGNIYIEGAIDTTTAAGRGTTVGYGTNQVYTDGMNDFVGVGNGQCSKTLYTLNVSLQNGVITAYIEEYPGISISVKTNSYYRGGVFSLYSKGCDQGGFESFSLSYVNNDQGTAGTVSQNFATLGSTEKLDTVAIQKENSKLNIAVDIGTAKNLALLRKKLVEKGKAL